MNKEREKSFGEHHCCGCEGHCHDGSGEEKNDLFNIITGAAVFTAAYLLTEFTDFPIWADFLILIIGYLFIGGRVIKGTLGNIRRGRIFDEGFLMTVSGIGAFAVGSYAEAAAVMFLYRLGEYLQEAAVGRSEKSVSALMDIRPDTAAVIRDGVEVEVKAEAVRVNEIIAVRPGERIPLDGVVVEGSASVDLSALTGESMPKTCKPGDEVLSGGVNLNGVLKIKVKKIYSESTASKIIDMVKNAAENKAPSENFITGFARYYTPIVVVLAALIAIIPPLFSGVWQEWIRRGLVFLVISCPCALVISVPLAFFGGIGAAASRGILIKGGNFLDALVKLETVVFDKTGTLTEGKFSMAKIIPAVGFSDREVLELAAQAEAFSNHPIAGSVKNEYGKEVDFSALSDYNEISGRGVKVKCGEKEILAGNKKMMEEAGIKADFSEETETVLYIAADNIYAGAILIADGIKKDTPKGIKELKNAGIKRIVMLTGDNEKTARRVSKELGIDEFHSDLLPDDKLKILEDLKKQTEKNKKLAFAGDGINDAPVLAGADIGIAMGALGSDAAIEASDIVLMTDEISKIAEAIRLAKKTRKIVTENIVISLGIKAIFLLLGALGEASMWQAVAGDVGVMLIAVLNALRILRK